MVARKREELEVQLVHDEAVVFNPSRSEATALNQVATVVFELCDGEHDVASMRQHLDDAGLGPASEDTVWLALRDLADAELIDLDVTPPEATSRREMLRKLAGGAVGAAALLPVVETITAPPAFAQGSRPAPVPSPRPVPTPRPITSKPTPQPTPSPTPRPTTTSPTTASPTTASPTTASPTTASPTTASPTTASPTTASPTTASPTTTTTTTTTARPTTVAPTTASPTTARPTRSP